MKPPSTTKCWPNRLIKTHFIEEEWKVLRWTASVLSAGILFKTVHLCHPFGLIDVSGTIFIALGAGSTASVTAQRIQRIVRERRLREHFGRYEGEWSRTQLIQYPYLGNGPMGQVKVNKRVRITDADGQTIRISHTSGRTLMLDVQYDEGRGRTKAQIEFPNDNSVGGTGTYVYVEGKLSTPEDNEGLPHSGTYTVHLFPQTEPDHIRVYYHGLMPDPDAKGYEVWQRSPSIQRSAARGLLQDPSLACSERP